MAAPQSYANHARIVPGYHYVTFGLLLLLLIWAGWRLAAETSVDRLMLLLLTVAVILVAFYARTFALTVQDRIIRLEMHLRLAELLPGDLQARIAELTPKQLVALRFASDAELAELVRAVLADGVTDPRAIKKMVRNWRPDYLRA
jgi:hypothetical protein